MTVVGTAKELRERRSGEERLNGSRRYLRVYLVNVTSEQDGLETVLTASGLPVLFNPYETETESVMNAGCIRRSPVQIGPTVWEVEIEYDSKPPGSQPNQDDPNPLLWLPKIAISFQTFQVPVSGNRIQNDDDYNYGDFEPGHAANNAIFQDGVVNSAGEPFDPPVTRDDSRLVMQITRNEINYFPVVALFYQDTVNADIFFGALPLQAKIMGITTTGKTKVTHEGFDIFYYPIVYTIHFRRDTWIKQILDQGTYYWPNVWGVGENTKFQSADGSPNVDLLNGLGDKAVIVGGAKVAEFLNFQVYREVPFGPLGLPQTMI